MDDAKFNEANIPSVYEHEIDQDNYGEDIKSEDEDQKEEEELYSLEQKVNI